MQIDYALILSAGLGTRMGEIGKKLPKVLWPIYFKSLLELQIRYCEELNIKKIYVNTHYLHDEILSFLNESGLHSKVVVLHEDPLLDSGGAIHNLASRPEIQYKGNLLLVNGDQFLFFKKEYWQKAVQSIDKNRAVLFGITVDKNSSYSETVLKDNHLIEIKKNTEKDHDYVTYSGLGLLRLDGLKPCPGISRFFETVANYKFEKIEFIIPAVFEYWDFGTAEIYAKNIFKLKASSERRSEMGMFLERNNAFSSDETKFLNLETHSIDLDYDGRFEKDAITGKGIVQSI